MAAAKSFTDLIVWQKAHAFVLAVYTITKKFPKDETYGLSSQLRRAAFSIPANIAESFKRYGSADKSRFLNIAQGSLEEARYFLILTKGLGYANTDHLSIQIEEVSKMLNSYEKKILSSDDLVLSSKRKVINSGKNKAN